jgi:hypothetical protein
MALGKSRSLVSFLERTGNVNRYTLAEICTILQTTPEELESEGMILQEHPSPDDNEGITAKDKLIEQLQDENRFLRETIEKQWDLMQKSKERKA